MKKLLVAVTSVFALLLYGLRRYVFAWGLGLARPRFRVKVARGLVVPAADGVRLMADRFFPAEAPSSPIVLIRSPYGRNAPSGVFGLLLEFCARRFAERGYQVVTQDTRGRFESEGQFEPLVHERADGQATLNWLAQQPWVNEQIGMWGPSYLGIVQWAVGDSPAIKALVPAVTASNLYPIVFPDDAFDLGLMMRWVSLLRAMDKYRQRLFIFDALMLFEVEQDIRLAFRHLPVIDADQKLRSGKIDYYSEWLQRAQDDPQWRETLQAVDRGCVHAPVHLIGGWYDFFLRGLLDDYAALKAAGKNPRLTIGPWQHFSNMFLTLSILKMGLEWFDIHLKGGRQQREKAVRLYVMGANEWREFGEYPPPSHARRYYLDGGRKLNLASSNSAPDCYRYDPRNPLKIWGGAQFHPFAGPRNNRRLERRRDVLVYSSAPLEQPVEVIGAVRLELYVRSSLENTDFFGRLCDVHPGGQSINICDGLFRIQPGKGELQADGTLRIEVDLWATAYRFQRGHCIRVLVSSSAHPRWNRHTGGSNPLTDTELRPADQMIYHDTQHPSALVLPVMLG
jgi:putative CocE/NonD family hydrolase